MENIFNDGFTNLSFLNLCKKMAEEMYDSAIQAPSNANSTYNTLGLRFNFIDDNDLNASVWIDGDNYDNMRFNTGTLNRIYANFYTLFSNKRMYTKIGDAGIEQNHLIKGEFDWKSRSIHFSNVPLSRNRRSIADLMALLASRYICAHELGHLLNGHAYLLNTLYGTQSIKMIEKSETSLPNEKIKLDYALDRRTLEMDADAFATTVGIINITGILQQKETFSEYLDILESPYQIFELWAFAIHSVFMQFELACPSNYDKKCFYLPNEARQILNFGSVNETIDLLIGEGAFQCSEAEKNVIMEYVGQGIHEAERYFVSVYNMKYASVEQNMRNQSFIDYVDEVRCHWDNDLRHKLKKYARAILYSPKETSKSKSE